MAEWLALRVEGNLLAAAQEVEILLLRGPGRLEVEALEASVADSARYSVFDLADAALAGNAARGLRILDLLRGEGAAEPLVLWALIREIRLVADWSRKAAAAGRRPRWWAGAGTSGKNAGPCTWAPCSGGPGPTIWPCWAYAPWRTGPSRACIRGTPGRCWKTSP